MRRYYIAWDAIALTAATAKTILELPTGSTVDIGIDEVFVGFDYANSSTLGSCKIQWGTFTTTGTGTAATPAPYGENRVASLVTASKVANTVEPTGFSQGTLGANAFRPSISIPLPGVHAWQAPTEKELYVPASTNYALRLTSTVACNTSGWVAWVE
jgi:hypothetical protein